MANATPAIFPLPTVPETAVARAWKCDTSPSSDDSSLSWSSYYPLTTLIAVKKYLIFGNPKYIVKNIALPTNNRITKGYPPTWKKTTLLKKSDIGANASSICLSNPLSWEKDKVDDITKTRLKNIFFIFLGDLFLGLTRCE